MARTKDSGKKTTIVVAGDLSVDWCKISRAPRAPYGGGTASTHARWPVLRCVDLAGPREPGFWLSSPEGGALERA
jgi:hypothetical protein